MGQDLGFRQAALPTAPGRAARAGLQSAQPPRPQAPGHAFAAVAQVTGAWARSSDPGPPQLPTYQPLTSFWEFTSTPLSTSFCTSRMSPKAAASRSLSCCSFCSRRALIFPSDPGQTWARPPRPARGLSAPPPRRPTPDHGERQWGSPALLAPPPAPGRGLPLPPAGRLPLARASSRAAALAGRLRGTLFRVTTLTQIFSVPTLGPGARAGCLCNCCTLLSAVIHGLFLDLPTPQLQGRRTDTWKEKKAYLRARKALSSGAGCLPGIKNNW